ncbi:MAG: hypothetical protein FWG52_04010 [Proteobacteria bacterium]|nr:hypothetical protein [Pseudomonadota bacterium]
MPRETLAAAVDLRQVSRPRQRGQGTSDGLKAHVGQGVCDFVDAVCARRRHPAKDAILCRGMPDGVGANIPPSRRAARPGDQVSGQRRDLPAQS